MELTLQHEGGVTEERWLGEEDGEGGDRPDLAITPPYMTRVTIPPGNHFPDQDYWLTGDAHYVVIKGIVCVQGPSRDKTEVERLGMTYIADMDKCPHNKCCLDKCRGDSCNLLYMFPGPFV